MVQVKIYGLRANLDRLRSSLSDAIHKSVITALNYPPEKRFHRFMGLERQDFLYPADRSEQYTIIELSMFAGRSVETKKALIQSLFHNIEQDCGISPHDIEITLFETARENWGIRGQTGDELALGYRVN
jgi:phenylpyruvate tautomerase PptA (4-oxalocrotonate tautomerase family)